MVLQTAHMEKRAEKKDVIVFQAYKITLSQ